MIVEPSLDRLHDRGTGSAGAHLPYGRVLSCNPCFRVSCGRCSKGTVYWFRISRLPAAGGKTICDVVADHDCDDEEADCKEDEDVSTEEDDEVCPASFLILTGYVIVLLKVFMIH